MTRSVLVTGASKGIGRAIACQLAADGFTVGVHYHRDADGAHETLEAIVQAGGTGRLLTFGVGNREQCREVLEQEISTFGAWYGVVSNAGITRDGAFPALSDEDWDRLVTWVDLNVPYAGDWREAYPPAPENLIRRREEIRRQDAAVQAQRAGR